MNQIRQFAIQEPNDQRVALIRTDWNGTPPQLVEALSRAVTRWINEMPNPKDWLDAQSGVTIASIADYIPGSLVTSSKLGQALRAEGIIYLEINWVEVFDSSNLDEPAFADTNLYRGASK